MNIQKENSCWKDYIREFNKNDEELYINDIPNAQAIEFLETQIPIVDLPDKTIERAYYFRWWTYRKHIKTTQEGHVITEFLPTVPWSSTHNAISCPAGFHIREGRWLKDEEGIVKDYIRFWLTFPEKMYCYSSWLAAAVEEYCEIHGDWAFAEEILEDLEVYFQKRIERSKKDIGLFYSEDCEDGMEVSISGNGLRPTASSYAYADAKALSRLAKRRGLYDKAKQYEVVAEDIKEKMMTLLWTGEFFQTIPEEYMNESCIYKGVRPAIAPEKSVQELIGYVPWYFCIPGEEKTEVFQKLLDPTIFYSPYGLTVADQSHPRFMEPHRHECLWNGPIWPFATTQVLVALANAVRDCKDTSSDSQPTGVYKPCKEDYYKLLHQYASSFQRTLPNGKIVDWIDENMDPKNGEWLARRILEGWGFKESKGGYERGKDYNHSMYCDLVLSGLLGIQARADGKLEVKPLIPDDWDYFRVQNLYFHGKKYEIVFDKDGTHYGEGTGLHIKNAV